MNSRSIAFQRRDLAAPFVIRSPRREALALARSEAPGRGSRGDGLRRPRAGRARSPARRLELERGGRFPASSTRAPARARRPGSDGRRRCSARGRESTRRRTLRSPRAPTAAVSPSGASPGRRSMRACVGGFFEAALWPLSPCAGSVRQAGLLATGVGTLAAGWLVRQLLAGEEGVRNGNDHPRAGGQGTLVSSNEPYAVISRHT